MVRGYKSVEIQLPWMQKANKQFLEHLVKGSYIAGYRNDLLSALVPSTAAANQKIQVLLNNREAKELPNKNNYHSYLKHANLLYFHL